MKFTLSCFLLDCYELSAARIELLVYDGSNEAQPRHFEIETSLGAIGDQFSHISGRFDGSDILSKPGYLCLELDGSGTRINRHPISILMK